MMSVDHLPIAFWLTSFGLSFVSSVFDNIPLTALALTQSGYDLGGAGLRGRLWRFHDLVWLPSWVPCRTCLPRPVQWGLA